jgi:ABC-type transporter Mla subunit MlaD
MASGNFILGVSAQITNLNDIQNQLKNLRLVKSISVPVELKNGQQAIKTVNTFKDKIGQTVREVKTFNTVTGKTSSEIKSVSLNIEKANKALNPFGAGLNNLLKTGAKVAVFSVLASAINGVKDAMASTIDVVKDFDDALTEFKKVSDLSGEALNNYAKQLGELGSTVARTRTELLEGATSFRKMGFSDAESAKLAQINAMFQNIADSEMSAEESAKILIGTMKGFGYGVDQMQNIIDVINEVSNNFSISSTDISNGLANVSAVASTAGNSLEQTTAMLTGMVEITQSAGKSSRGLKFCLGSR